MTASQVLQLMGEPDYSAKGFRKGSAEFAYDVWQYVLELPADAWQDDGSRVLVWFDFTGRVRAMSLLKVAGDGFEDDEKEGCS